MSSTAKTLYSVLKENICSDIENGVLNPGDKLPTHHELCDRYSMSYMTIRRAISELTTEGLLIAVQGKGIYVAEKKHIVEISGIKSFTEDMEQRGWKSKARVLEAKTIGASTMIAKILNVTSGFPLVYLRRLRFANDQPLAIQSVYISTKLCPDLLKHNLESESLYSVLKDDYGLKINMSSGTVGAELASEEDSNLLQISRPAALLLTERIVYQTPDNPLEFSRSLYRADRYQLPLKD
jgi:GntR family transcriptional regulator